MAKQLINNAETSAQYQGSIYEDTTQLIVNLDPVSIEKIADKMLWIDTNPLTYTVRIKNNAETGGDPLTSVSFEDFIDPQIAELDTGSVTVNGAPQTLGTDFTYDTTSGVLRFDPLADIAAGATVEIIFRVTKV